MSVVGVGGVGVGIAGVDSGSEVRAVADSPREALAVCSKICCVAAFITSGDYQFAGISANFRYGALRSALQERCLLGCVAVFELCEERRGLGIERRRPAALQ